MTHKLPLCSFESTVRSNWGVGTVPVEGFDGGVERTIVIDPSSCPIFRTQYDYAVDSSPLSCVMYAAVRLGLHMMLRCGVACRCVLRWVGRGSRYGCVRASESSDYER